MNRIILNKGCIGSVTNKLCQPVFKNIVFMTTLSPFDNKERAEENQYIRDHEKYTSQNIDEKKIKLNLNKLEDILGKEIHLKSKFKIAIFRGINNPMSINEFQFCKRSKMTRWLSKSF